jgi:hypothetical protein
MTTTITQRHRVAAVAKLKGTASKDDAVRAAILAGRADEHPLVQAAAFYGS